MNKVFLFLLLSVLSLTAKGQQCLVTDGELLGHGISRTGVVPEALQQLLRGRSWQIENGQLPRRLSARAMRQGHQNAVNQTIGPLLQSIRAQEEPYNLLCPRWTYNDSTVSETHCLSGCVATAIEQVMAYYQYPEALKDTLFGWQTEHYVIEDMLPGTRFDWSNYLQDYRDGWTTEQGMAIALPSLAAGMAVHMNYGIESSGASVWRAVEPLQRAFGYGMAEYFERVFYTPAHWHAMLQYELEHARPIVYAGHNMDMGGHAFNIDGVDAAGFYHVNWGYNGYYDGWYDLDLLDPWEPIDRQENGYVVGFFCNHSALFMHPSAEEQPLQTDTLSLDSLGVVLEKVTFLRQPDVSGYVQADFYFLNTGTDSVTYAYEVMTWLPTDTAIFYQADYVGLAGLTLAPGERRIQRNYLRFYEMGERLFGISHDDVTIPFQMPVTIAPGVPARLEWSGVESEVAEVDDATGLCSCIFRVPVRNLSEGGYAADAVIFCLYADGMENEDMRHYTVLSLPGGEAETLSVTFTHLQPATHYTFLVRCPWAVRAQTDFTTPPAVGIAAVAKPPIVSGPWFQADGRSSSAVSRGIIIQRGKKWFRN